ncbi:glycoside hydrolase family 5 protein [Sphingomonas koreensis]|nr:glycoside hydrolase family 5 protein [Sphingomonas koreensis]
MANMLEPPHEGGWGRPIADDDFQIIARAGFQTVRIPINFGAHAADRAPYAIDPAFMDRVAHVVDLATAAHLRAIIDLHNDDALVADPAAEAPRLAAMWQQIGARFADAPDSVWFELTNEPHGALDNHNLRATLDPALAAVRGTNPTRKVVIGGQNYSGIDSLATIDLPSDPNVIATFHYYDPFRFTHQGARWADPMPPVGATFGSPADRAELAANVAKAKAFMARTGRPLFMGEYGAYDATITVEKRADYYHAVHDAFAGAGIDGCVWGYTNGFKFRDGDHWIAPLLTAIGLPQ